MPTPFPAEFRRGDFAEVTLHNWLKKAEAEDGTRPAAPVAEAAELRDAKKRIRLLEHENEILRRAAARFGARLLQAGLLCMEAGSGDGPGLG